MRAGDFIFCSGQIALDPETGQLVGDGQVRDETERVLANLQAVLDAAGATFADVVKTTVYLADMSDFSEFNEVYGTHFDSDPPARACVEVSGLPRGARVEIDLVALSARRDR